MHYISSLANDCPIVTKFDMFLQTRKYNILYYIAILILASRDEVQTMVGNNIYLSLIGSSAVVILLISSSHVVNVPERTRGSSDYHTNIIDNIYCVCAFNYFTSK